MNVLQFKREIAEAIYLMAREPFEHRAIGEERENISASAPNVSINRGSDILRYKSRAQNHPIYRAAEEEVLGVSDFPKVVVNDGGLYSNSDYLVSVNYDTHYDSFSAAEFDDTGSGYKFNYLDNSGKSFPGKWTKGSTVSYKEMEEWLDTATGKTLPAAKVMLDQRRAIQDRPKLLKAYDQLNKSKMAREAA